jgi:nucleoside-diphosphate-sugar epimerase
MKVLVTGSSGFIGRHVAAGLGAAGHAVLGVDRTASAEPLDYPQETCDILDAPRLLRIVTRYAPDAIVHLAARTDLEEKLDLNAYAANTTGVENIIAAVRSTPSVRRVIYTSTQLVCRVGYRPAHDQDYAPNNVYGQSKVLGEQIVRSSDGGGASWCIVRPTTVWGPGMSLHYQRFLRMIRNGTYFHVGRRPLLKSFGYVENVAYQYRRLLEVPAAEMHRHTFYVGDYDPIPLQHWADALSGKLGGKRIPSLPYWLAAVAARIGDTVNWLGFRSFPFNSFRLRNVMTEDTFDMSNTRAVCGEVPYSLDEAAEITARWFLAKRATRQR